MENVNQALPEVEIDLGGVKHKIVCNFLVLARYEKLTKKDPFKEFVTGRLSATSCIELISSALYADPENHLDEIATQLGAKHLRDVLKVVRNLFLVSFPKPDKDEEAEAEGEEDPEETPESENESETEASTYSTPGQSGSTTSD